MCDDELYTVHVLQYVRYCYNKKKSRNKQTINKRNKDNTKNIAKNNNNNNTKSFPLSGFVVSGVSPAYKHTTNKKVI